VQSRKKEAPDTAQNERDDTLPPKAPSHPGKQALALPRSNPASHPGSCLIRSARFMADVRSQLAVNAVQPPPEAGQLVNVRKRRFVVTGLQASGLPLASNGGAQPAAGSLVHLSCVEDDGMGEELTVLWQLEPGARSHDVAAPPTPQPDLFEQNGEL
jgi:hypothetical protein